MTIRQRITNNINENRKSFDKSVIIVFSTGVLCLISIFVCMHLTRNDNYLNNEHLYYIGNIGMLLTIIVMFSVFIYALVIRKKYSIIFNCPKCNNSLIDPELHPDKGYIGNMKAVLEVSINNIQNINNCRNCGLDLDSQENEL